VSRPAPIPNEADASARADALARETQGVASETARRFPWPLAIFIALAILLGAGLFLDPREIPSPLVDGPVPQFRLPPVEGRTQGLATGDLRGEVSVVNVFASWCTACRDEHPLWMEVSRNRAFPLHGLNYKDQPADAAKWLSQLGDPYVRTGADIDGRAGIDWGVYGVPETFIVDKRGIIRRKIIGPVTREKLDAEVLPFVRKLREE
jgi:cytochrome c biogenesis protein CcmG, thiol:disulfide interchange protein DsbE